MKCLRIRADDIYYYTFQEDVKNTHLKRLHVNRTARTMA